MAVEKPAGVLVHRSTERVAIPLGRYDLVRILRNQMGERIYPIHRLDRATSGVLLVGRTPAAARELQAQFQMHQVNKTYVALVRGWTHDKELLDSPLTRSLDGEELVPATTHLETLCRVEIPVSNARYETSRFSLIKVRPITGRIHQIRRHLKRESHPIIGDTVYGDGVQNRIFREFTGDRGLYLKAYSLEFSHLQTGERVLVRSKWNGVWHRLFDQIKVCPTI